MGDAVVGMLVGKAVGLFEGPDGEYVGTQVGLKVGFTVGMSDGKAVGVNDGPVGRLDGERVGVIVGFAEGEIVEGEEVGLRGEGTIEGPEGLAVGAALGRALGQ